jgi:hypothetical protein
MAIPLAVDLKAISGAGAIKNPSVPGATLIADLWGWGEGDISWFLLAWLGFQAWGKWGKASGQLNRFCRKPAWVHTRIQAWLHSHSGPLRARGPPRGGTHKIGVKE